MTIRSALIIPLCFALFSCSRNQLSRIEKRKGKDIERVTKTIYAQHGNVFHYDVSYYRSFIIWYYKDLQIFYKSYQGRKVQKKGTITPACKNFKTDDIVFPDFDSCITLDGQSVGYIISSNNILQKETHPTDIKCLFEQDTLSENCFLTDMKNVLRTNNVVVDTTIYYYPAKK